MRVGRHAGGRSGNPDLVEEAEGFGGCSGAGEAAMEADGFGHLAADAVDRVERGGRVLEDHADAAAADAVERSGGCAEELLAVEADAAGDGGRRE